MFKGIIIGIVLTLVIEHVGLARVGSLADQGIAQARSAAGKVNAEVSK